VPPVAWLNGRLVPWHEATLHVDTLAVLGGLNAYEVMGAFWSESQRQLHLFRPQAHMERLAYSTKVMRIPLAFSFGEIVDGAVQLLREWDPHEDFGVRVVAYLGSGPLSTPDTGSVEAGVFMIAKPSPSEMRRSELHVATSKWIRLPDTAAPPRVKSGANYQNARLAQMQARIDGYDDAVILNAAGKVCELPLANLFAVRDGVLMTPTVTSGILEGITRRTILDAVGRIEVDVIEREIDRSELYAAEEIFATGTLSGVTPVVSVDRYPVGDGRPGPITERIRTLLRGLQRDPSIGGQWCTAVLGVAAGATPRDTNQGGSHGSASGQS
jgi:branched-chain amino acid aminotransferase